MKNMATWLVLAAVGAVVVAGVADALRGSRSHSGQAHAARPAAGSPATAAAQLRGTVESTPAPRLPRCSTAQLDLTFTRADGLAALLLRRVRGRPCHEGRSAIRFILRDQAGRRVPMFLSSGELRFTRPADFSHGFEQLIQIPYTAVCDSAASFLAVATVGRYEARREVPGANLSCHHS